MTVVCLCVHVESALQLVYASKEAGGNVKSTASHVKVDEASVLVDQATIELTSTLENAGGMDGLITGKGSFLNMWLWFTISFKMLKG